MAAIVSVFVSTNLREVELLEIL